MAPLRILIIDDDRDDAELARLALQDADLVAELRIVSRRDALERTLEGFTPQLVLCDLNFPGWPCAEIRAELARVAPGARFVLHTGVLPLEGTLPDADAVLLKGQLQQLPALLHRLLPDPDAGPHTG